MGDEDVAAGTILDVLAVETGNTVGKMKAKWVKIQLENTNEVRYLRMQLGNIKVRRVEKNLNGNIKFIK